MRQDEEFGERDRVRLAQGEVFEPAVLDERDVQQLRRGGRRLGPSRGEGPVSGMTTFPQFLFST